MRFSLSSLFLPLTLSTLCFDRSLFYKDSGLLGIAELQLTARPHIHWLRMLGVVVQPRFPIPATDSEQQLRPNQTSYFPGYKQPCRRAGLKLSVAVQLSLVVRPKTSSCHSSSNPSSLTVPSVDAPISTAAAIFSSSW